MIKETPYKIIFLTVFIPILFFNCSNQTKKDKEYKFEQKSLTIDTSFIAKTSVNGICPCETTLSDIMKSSKLKRVNVENMELGENCIGSSKFEDGNCYSLLTTKGMIVQKNDDTEYVTKIHLTKEFEGKLPDGQFVSVKNLKVKDVAAMYPNFTYNSRMCSDYWNYSNDTIYFYFKKDKSVKWNSQDDNQYYADEPIEGIDIVLWCYSMHSPEYSDGFVYQRPLYAPLSETHVNTCVWEHRNDIATKIKEIISFGKETNFNIIKLGKWLEYSTDHELITEEYYDNKGNLLKKVR